MKFFVRSFAVLSIAALFGLFALSLSFCFIGWSDEGSEDYPGGIVLRDANGEIIRVSLGPDDVDSRPFYRASKEDLIVKALVASEDGTFFEHNGVRPLSVLRALWQNIMSNRRVSGASTITSDRAAYQAPPQDLYRQMD